MLLVKLFVFALLSFSSCYFVFLETIFDGAFAFFNEGAGMENCECAWHNNCVQESVVYTLRFLNIYT